MVTNDLTWMGSFFFLAMADLLFVFYVRSLLEVKLP